MSQKQPFDTWWDALKPAKYNGAWKEYGLARDAWDAAMELAAQTAWDADTHHDAQENILALKVR